jgi:glycosyltransferase involved in cell wall biosynthesis
MRLLFISPFFYPHSGGGEKYAEELFSKLITLHPEIQVDILCYNTNNAPTYEQYKGLTIYRVSAFDLVKQQFYLPNPLYLIPLLFKLARNRYDLVGTQTRFFDATWWTWLYAKLIGAKSLFIGHGTGFVSHHLGYVRFFAKLVDLSIAKLALRFYDYRVVISHSTQVFFAQKLGIKDTLLVYGGLDTSLFVSQKENSRTVPKIQTSLDPDAVVITYIGRLIEAKGIWVLLEAYKQFLPTQVEKETILIIGGGGPLDQEIKEEIDRSSLKDRVIMLGDLSYPEVQELLKVTDIFINPSFNEGLPRTVLEAAAAGCVVIATDVGSTNEIIIDGQTGYLIPPRDEKALQETLKEVLNDTDQSKKLGEEAQQHVQSKFDWQVIVENFYNAVFGSIVAKVQKSS